jgi:HSP20 family molecular chaperone IbpA
MLLDRLFNEPLHTWSAVDFEKPAFTSLPLSQHYTEKDGETIKVFINCVGHNPKDIELDATEDEIHIKSLKSESSNRFVRDINLKFTVGVDYDGTNSDASFDNGVLILTLDKKEEKKTKKIKLKF